MPDDLVTTQGQQPGPPGGATAPAGAGAAPAAEHTAEGAQQTQQGAEPPAGGTPVPEGDWQGLMRQLESKDKQIRDKETEIVQGRTLKNRLEELGGLDAVQQQIALAQKAKELLGDNPETWQQRRAEIQSQAAQAVRDAPPPPTTIRRDGSTLVDYDTYLLGMKHNTMQEKAEQYMSAGYSEAQAKATAEREAIAITAEVAAGLAKGGMPVSRAVLAQLGVDMPSGPQGQQDLTGFVKATDVSNLVNQAVQQALSQRDSVRQSVYRRLDEGSQLIEKVAPGFLSERVTLNGSTDTRESHIEDFMSAHPDASVAQAISSLFFFDVVSDAQARGRRQAEAQLRQEQATYSPLGGGQAVPQQEAGAAQQIIEALEARGVGTGDATLRREKSGYAPMTFAPRWEQS